MKKLLSVLLTVVLIVCIAPVGIAVNAATSGNYTYEVKSGKAIITDVNTNISGDITIPASLGGYTVTTIGDRAFYECNRLTGVTVPEGVVEIGEAAFGFCQKLANVSLPTTVKTIADGAFSDCIKLDGITIPDSVEVIGDLAFSNCDNINEVVIPNSVTRLGEYAFGWCNRLSKVTVGNGVSVINAGVFFDCQNLDSVKLGNNVASIDDLAFYNAQISNISIPNGVTRIGNSAFENCYKLEQITLPKTVENIDNYAFCNCSLLSVVWYWGEESSTINIGHYNECLTDATWNYGLCEDGEHIYSGSCLKGCTACGWTPTAHSYTNACDKRCNECDAVRSIKSHTHAECFNGYSEELYGYWDITVSKSCVYTLKPSSKYTGEFNVHNISVFDKDNQKVLYYERLGGFPLVAGQDYTVKFRYDCSDEINGTLGWTKTRIADTIFTDVSSSEWYNDAVTYSVGRGIISGYGGTTKFGPGDNIQRQDFLVILARLDGVDLTSYGNKKSAFPDVPEGSYYEAAVNWGSEKGIVSGYQNGKFGTGDKITREQLVTFLYRYAGYKGLNTSYTTTQKNKVKNTYTDYKNVTDYAQDPVIWAVTNGVINGKTSTTIVPGGNALRCEVAQIMYNIFLKDIF